MTKKSKIVVFAIFFIVLIGAGTMVVCRSIFFKSVPKQSDEEIPVVRTMTVHSVTGDSESFSYSGEVRGRYESQLAFQTGGKIIERNVQLGSRVKTGQILMRVDPVDVKQGVNIAKAQLASIQSQFQLAKDNYERFETLYAKHAVSKVELDNALNNYKTAEAALNQVKSQYANASHQYNDSNLYANMGGVVTTVNAEIGQVVGTGQPVVTVVRDGEKEVEINVPENRLEELRRAHQLQVTFWALPNLIVSARVREVAPMADELSHTYKVRVSLVNPPTELKLGMTATVSVSGIAQASTVINLPLTAIYQTGEQPKVWVVNHGVAYQRAVKIDGFGDDQVQVVSGLNNGDLVVTAGVQLLQEGQRVRKGDNL